MPSPRTSVLPRRAGLSGGAVPPPDQACRRISTSVGRRAGRLLPLRAGRKTRRAGEAGQAATRKAPDCLAARHDARDIFPIFGGDRQRDAGEGTGCMVDDDAAARPQIPRSTRCSMAPSRSCLDMQVKRNGHDDRYGESFRSNPRLMAVHSRLHRCFAVVDDLRHYRHPDPKGSWPFGHAIRVCLLEHLS